MTDETRLRVTSDVDIVSARQTGRAWAEQLGFSLTDLTGIATAISEIARNMTTYAGHGELILRVENARGRPALVVTAIDDGPGILDIQAALEEGFSTGSGLGLGLPGARRLMDELEIESEPGRGTRVTMRKWLPGDR
jgi:serine/threonine-protein kinase RsbT